MRVRGVTSGLVDDAATRSESRDWIEAVARVAISPLVAGAAAADALLLLLPLLSPATPAQPLPASCSRFRTATRLPPPVALPPSLVALMPATTTAPAARAAPRPGYPSLITLACVLHLYTSLAAAKLFPFPRFPRNSLARLLALSPSRTHLPLKVGFRPRFALPHPLPACLSVVSLA